MIDALIVADVLMNVSVVRMTDKTPTPSRELAERIAGMYPSMKTTDVEIIESLIDGALAEEFASGAIDQQKRCKEHKASTYEECAKIADEAWRITPLGTAEEIAAKIRALQEK